MFRELKNYEVEARVARITTGNEQGVVLHLYKDARCDMKILDEAGVKWQRRHEEHKGVIYCRVGIYDEDINEWVWREDAGAESYTEKEKGEASDSFKRACTNWGIGRELYTAPFIWVPAEKCNIRNGKCYDHFYVQTLKVEDGKIVGLVIVNLDKDNAVVYRNGV